jgi:hypothetical protein
VNRRTANPNISSLPDVSLDAVVREALPSPMVQYPDHWGTFFSFSERESTITILCDCSRSAID